MTSRLDHLPEERRREIAEDLSEMLALDQEAAEGYEEAMRRLDNAEWAHQVDAFRDEHVRHAGEIERMLQRLGGNAASPAGRERGMAAAMRELSGDEDDRRILETLRDQEARIKFSYDRFAAKDYPTEIDRLVERHARDEHDHHGWAADALRAGGPPGG